MKPQLAACLALLLAGSAVAAPALPLASNLQRDGQAAARAGTPLVLLFTLPDCAYCHVVRRNYLAPLAASGAPRYIVREIVVQGKARATGLDGKPTTHCALAERFGVRFAPTVLFVDRSGRELAAPLLGGDTAGMYGAYLESRLAEAGARLAATSN